MNNLRYLALDTETGGLGLDTSLLTLGMVVTDENFDILDKSIFELKLIPDDGIYHVTPQAMEVNKIDLVWLADDAWSYKEAGTTLYEYLKEFSQDGKVKLTPIGKQVAGDILRVQKYLLKKATWEQFVSYQPLDVSSVFKLMQNLGFYPEDAGGSLKWLLDYYKLDSSHQHDALADVKYTLQVLQRMRGELRNGLVATQNAKNGLLL